jgi:tRNA(Ile2) C34 agmatinyltransferase TiaS
MFILKACPRCSGDLYSGMDDDLTCMQCGRELSDEERQRLLRRVRPVREPAGQRSR